MCSPLGRRSSSHSLLNCPSRGRRWASLYQSPLLMTANPFLLKKRREEGSWAEEAKPWNVKGRWIESCRRRERKKVSLEVGINSLMFGWYWPLPLSLHIFPFLFRLQTHTHTRRPSPSPLLRFVMQRSVQGKRTVNALVSSSSSGDTGLHLSSSCDS